MADDLREQVARWLASARPDATLLEMGSLDGGISATMRSLTFDADGDQTTWVVRQPSDWTNTNDPTSLGRQEALLRSLAEQSFPAPEAIYRDESGAHFDRPTMILSFIPGSPDLTFDHSAPLLAEHARVLALLHKLPVVDQLTDLPTESWFERYTEEHIPDDDVMKIGRLLKVLDQVETPAQANEDVLLHADLWPGNVIFSQGSLVGVVDWEEARRGDPLLDLSLCRLDLSWVFGYSAADRFTALYLEANPIDVSALAWWDVKIALRAAEMDKDWSDSYTALGRPDITFQHMKEVRTGFMEDAIALL